MKYVSKSLACLAISVCGASAWAVDGTVTVQGTVANTTCTIVLTGGTVASNNLTITLPTVGVNALASLGQTTGSTPFTIGVKNCANVGAYTTFTPYFEGGTINTNGRVGTSGANINVDVQITTGSGGVVNMAAASGLQGISTTALSSNATVNASSFIAKYYANGAATAGSFSGTFNYSLVYN